MPPRLAIVATHVIQYFSPVYREIARLGEVDLRVIYYSDAGTKPMRDPGFGQEVQWDVDLIAGFDSVVLHPDAPLTGLGWRGVDSPRLEAALDDFGPDAVLVYGYGNGLAWRARRWAVRNRKKILYFSDSNQELPRPLWKRVLKRWVVRRFFRSVSVFLAVGERNDDYIREYGATPERIVRCPFAIDVSMFDRVLYGNAKQARGALREKLGIPSSAFVVVFAAKFIALKRPQDVVDAIGCLRRHSVGVHALMVGSGPLLEAMRDRAEKSGVADLMHWPGFVNQAEIPIYYATGDALVMPSERDAYGLVVPEAAACGLPVIVSHNLGCVGPTAAARDGENAIVYPCGDVEALAAAIRRLAENPEERERMGRRSREIAETQDVKVAARVIAQAVRAMIGTYEREKNG